MNPFDNFGMLFQGIQTNNLLANMPSFNIGTDLTVKQPMLTMPNLVNMRASYNGASAIDNVFDSNQSTNNPVTQFNSIMPQIGAMNNFWSPFSSSTMSGIGQPPTPNLSSLGSAPTSAAPFMISMGIAMGLIDPASVGMSAATSTQSTSSQAAAIKNTPVMSAGTVEKSLNKEVTSPVSSQKASFITADGSGYTLFNRTLPDNASKAEFIKSLSSDIDKEVRLAGRGASKEVVAEIMANKIYELYSKSQPANVQDAERNIKGYKNKVLTGLKNICMGNVDAKTLQSGALQWGTKEELPEGVAEALAILPAASSKDDPGNTGGVFSGWGGWFGNRNSSLTVKILEETTNDLTATAKENLIKRNSLA